LQFRSTVSTSSVSLRAKSTRDWLSIDGEAKIDSKMVLDLKAFLKLLDDSPGRFVKLEDGSFIHITNQLRKVLDETQRIGKPTKEGIQIHPLAVSYAAEIFADVGEFVQSPKWGETLRKIARVESVTPALPSTFQGNLRDYQLEGFQWLARLEELSMGACLADDMGLGKTIQALAVLLKSATKGPSMVVAPTSVIQNWQREANRFAPTLKPILMHDLADRKDALSNLGPYDLLITSYGLMHNELENLSAVRFEIVVLDEAQAIKNHKTQRARAARSLNAAFKMITTGTPIENHLSELWSLFEFINPGLLGTHPSFNKRFAIPIEKQNDKAARHSLRRLINPFILRRNKSEILDELPPRTEIELKVELSNEERAFYEAVRQQAVETLEDKKGNQQLTILAEIMRLRRACCHPKLVQSDIPIAASKLQLFLELVDELRENGHKALVFSQFVDHLGLIKDALDEQGVSYCYLDGSTPMKHRSREVDLFQAGERDLFLISLRAGGTGLNLTAADYVIHMDPWWNPAVEDQASDRAHRIGQTRPVTIYRLVTKGTIEEKIVELHRSKRDLADKLLVGTDQPTTLSANDLVDLIRRDI
jgi:SNF2 family DNA or RNA helicase